MRARRLNWLWVSLVSLSCIWLHGCAATTGAPCDSAACGPGERCLVDGDGNTTCAATCTTSQSCGAEAPICDDTIATCRQCAAGEDRRCRERSASTPRCVGGQCVACVAPRGLPGESADCRSGSGPSATPICDKSVCRACQKHSECESGVCAKDHSGDELGNLQGTCVPIEQILVVDQDLCSRSGPVFCTPAQAFARLGPSSRYVLLRKSAQLSDFSGLVLGDVPAQVTRPVVIIGPLADHPPHRTTSLPAVAIGGIASQDGLTISHGKVLLEGLFVQGAKSGISCTNSDANVQIVRSFFSGNATAVSASGGCQLTVAETWIGSGPAHTGFEGLPGNTRGIEIAASEFHIINTMFVDDGDYRQDALGGVRVRSLSSGTRRSTIVNSTFYQQHGLVKGGKYLTSLLCDGLVGDRLVIFNSLFFGDQPLLTSPEEHYLDPACGTQLYNLGSNDSTLTSNQSVVVPATASLFIDAPARDLRLISGGAPERIAIGGGGLRSITVGTDLIAAPDSDLDGMPRGPGAAAGKDQTLMSPSLAIGAFEPIVKAAP